MMKKFAFAALVASSLTAALLGVAAPAQAGVDNGPSLPHYSIDNHDEVSTTGGFVDQPF